MTRDYDVDEVADAKRGPVYRDGVRLFCIHEFPSDFVDD